MLLNFRNYLIEARDSNIMGAGPLLHSYHPSSLGHLAGPEGTARALETLNNLHEHIKKGKLPAETSVKVDGSPSLVLTGPSAGAPRGSVSTKTQEVTKNPKINKSHEDIDINHGDKPLLANKLKDVHDIVASTIPPGMKVQGDLMHTGHDVATEDIEGVPHYTFKSNLMKYAVPVESEEGQKVGNSKVGLAIHTIYDEHGNARPIKDSELAKLSQNPDVHMMSVKPEGKPEIDFQKSNRVAQHLQNAAAIHDAMVKSGGYEPVMQHGQDLETYVNHTVRHNQPQNLEGFAQWIADRGERKASEMKTAKSQAMKREAAQAVIDHVMRHKEHFNNALALQNELENATSHLSDSMMRTHGYRTFIGDQEVGPEGHMLNGLKIVRRRSDPETGRPGFSQMNFQQGMMQQQRKKK